MTSVVAIQMVWTRVLPRSASALTSAVGGAILLMTSVKNSAARTPEKTGQAISASSRITRLSLDARSEACPGGIGPNASATSPTTAATSQTITTTRIAVALFLIGQPT